RDRSEFNELLELQTVLFEFTDRERGAVDRQRRRNDVDTRTVRKARVANGAGFDDPAPDLADDALADVHQLLVIGKPDARLLHFAADFDERRSSSVHHDIGDIVTREQRL